MTVVDERLSWVSEAEAAQLRDKLYFVRDNFLDPDTAALGRETLLGLYAKGKFEAVGMNPLGTNIKRELRGDDAMWLDEKDPAYQPFAPSFERLRRGLNARGRLDLYDYCEVQAARYGGNGERYVTHLDALPSHFFKRRVTGIVYLNPDWRPEHGGALKMHFDDKTELTVEPLFNRLVVFMSETVPHEVLPTYAPRLAVTRWYFLMKGTSDKEDAAVQG